MRIEGHRQLLSAELCDLREKKQLIERDVKADGSLQATTVSPASECGGEIITSIVTLSIGILIITIAAAQYALNYTKTTSSFHSVHHQSMMGS